VTAFWPWAVKRYARPGAAEALLSLQDAHGVNVPLLLWALWLDAHGLDGDVEAAVDLTRRFSPAVDALRAARRALKASAPPIKDGPRKALRRRVKALELESERLLMLALERFAHPGPAAETALARVLRART